MAAALIMYDSTRLCVSVLFSTQAGAHSRPDGRQNFSDDDQQADNLGALSSISFGA